MKKLYTYFLSVLFILTGNLSAKATTDTLRSGSFIINMGVIPQTIGNGLKPYGLVYNLVKNHNVLVKWVINGAKSKDGIDFTHNGVQYRGGTFIIPFEFRTPAVNAVISAWQAQGVIGNTSASDMILDVTKTIYFAPKWTLDKQNGRIATSYFANAGIPSTAYGGDSVNWKNPGELNECDDIFVMPHADPTWATHNNLYYWNQVHKGNLWAACHAVSELENLRNPANTIKMNFLTTNGMILWSDHRRDATPPYLYRDHGNPIMQFMQVLDNATTIGSEQTYLPKLGSAWRASTTVAVYDNSNIFIPILSPGPPAVVAYGRGFGDPNRGYVMYEAGHDHNINGTVAERVAAQRAFFNYSFFVAVDRYVALATSISGLPEVIIGNTTYTLSFDVPAGLDLTNYTVDWSSSSGGSFASTGNKQSINFTTPATQGATIVTVSITDGCGREVFTSQGSYVSTVLPTAVQLQGSYVEASNLVQLKWTETNNLSVNHYEIERADNKNVFKTISLYFPEETGDKVNYVFTDKSAPAGYNKYRLKVYNKAKVPAYSNTIKITTGKVEEAGVSVIGNPVRSTLTFEYRSPVTENITATLLDVNGRTVASKKLTVQKGSSIIQMGNLSHQPAGLYLLQVVADGKSIVSRINLVK
jgi:hypothetical protein